LSHYFKRHRQEYYERLQATRDNGDWEEWLSFFFRGVTEVSKEATETARRILLLRERDRESITANLGRSAGNGHRVLEALYYRPIMTVADVQELIGTTYQAANTLVRRLEELGVLEEITGYARNRRYRYGAYVRLFSEGTEN